MNILKSETCVAVYDVDGTLLSQNIGLTFVKYLLSRKLVQWHVSLLIFAVYILYKVGVLGFEAPIRAGAWALRGLTTDHVQKLAKLCFETDIRPAIFSDAINEISTCRRDGMKIVIATGAHEAIAKPLADFIGADICVATRSKVIEGRYSLQLLQPIPFREGKSEAVHAAITEAYGRSSMTVYTDEQKDIPLLASAQQMVAVNADSETISFVKARGGRVVTFK